MSIWGSSQQVCCSCRYWCGRRKIDFTASFFEAKKLKDIFYFEKSNDPNEHTIEFNINDYMRKTWYMYGGQETKVVVKFTIGCKKVVTERNMAVGRIIEENDEYFIYEFICNGVKGIRIWLMGFGADAEVLEPAELRDEIKDTVASMARVYGV